MDSRIISIRIPQPQQLKQINKLRYSKSGLYIAAIDEAGILNIFDCQNSVSITTFQYKLVADVHWIGSDATFQDLAFLAIHLDGSVSFCDFCRQTWKKVGFPVGGSLIVAEGFINQLALATSDQRVRLYSLELDEDIPLRYLASFGPFNDEVKSLCWYDEGRLFVGTNKNTIEEINVSEKRITNSLGSSFASETPSINAIIAIQERNFIVAGTSQGSVVFWDLNSYTLLSSHSQHNEAVTALARTPGKLSVYSLSVSGTLALLTCINEGWVHVTRRVCHGRASSGLAVSPFKGLVVSGGGDGAICLSSDERDERGWRQSRRYLGTEGMYSEKAVIIGEGDKLRVLVANYQKECVEVYDLVDDNKTIKDVVKFKGKLVTRDRRMIKYDVTPMKEELFTCYLGMLDGYNSGNVCVSLTATIESPGVVQVLRVEHRVIISCDKSVTIYNDKSPYEKIGVCTLDCVFKIFANKNFIMISARKNNVIGLYEMTLNGSISERSIKLIDGDNDDILKSPIVTAVFSDSYMAVITLEGIGFVLERSNCVGLNPDEKTSWSLKTSLPHLKKRIGSLCFNDKGDKLLIASCFHYIIFDINHNNLIAIDSLSSFKVSKRMCTDPIQQTFWLPHPKHEYAFLFVTSNVHVYITHSGIASLHKPDVPELTTNPHKSDQLVKIAKTLLSSGIEKFRGNFLQSFIDAKYYDDPTDIKRKNKQKILDNSTTFRKIATQKTPARLHTYPLLLNPKNGCIFVSLQYRKHQLGALKRKRTFGN